MDDSEQDFVDLCSKLLKRVRKKPGDARPPRRAESDQSASSQASEKRRRNNKKDVDSGSKVTGTQVVCSGTGCESGDAGSLGVPSGASAERGQTAKAKVLLRMQQFKRASPQRMVHRDVSQAASHEIDHTPNPLPQGQEPPQPCISGPHPDSDEALALRLQQELDREAAEAEVMDLEDAGLFFCQICHRDLSHMTPEGRTQHINRCLDDREGSVPHPPPPPALPECPICGKIFKSQKSRSAHLKRCSSDMGVSPAVLLQALQRQAEETQNAPTVNTERTQTGGTKRKGPHKPGLPARKKPRKKTDPLDEDTMVALALSSSLREQDREAQRELKTELGASLTPMTLVLKPYKGQERRKKKKGAVPRPPPLLLVQDAQAALVRLQERVSALLLHSRPPSPPTPTRCPSGLCGWSSAASLWQKSTLLSFTCQSDFYTPELREFITPWETPKTAAVPLNAGNTSESFLRPLTEGTPVAGTRTSILPSSSQTPASSSATSTPGTGQLPVGSQALRDLMELAEDGMTLTQCGYMTSWPDKNEKSRASLSRNLRLSSSVLEEAEQQADLCVSGFLPEAAHTHSDNTQRKRDEPHGDEERGSHPSVALSRLASDLGSMVNNPQLSDVQIQVDSGDVYFAHSFMVYARCPLLAEMVHEGGFGEQEEGSPAAQRVLMSDVPGQAVLLLLQYLYTAHCSIPAPLRPHILELASRFDLHELQQLCESPTPDDTNHGENISDQTDQAFMVLLRSMWNEEDEDEEDEGMDTGGGDDDDDEERTLEEDHRQTDDVTSSEREIYEEPVNEDELEEIYEFAATQRKRDDEKDRAEDDEEEEKVDDGEEELAERDLSKKTPKNSQLAPDPSQDATSSHLFSNTWGVYEHKDPSSSSPSTSSPPETHTSRSQTHQSSHKPLCEFSGRTLLQSSPSVSAEFSQSPPPSTSILPIAGLSPGQMSESGTDAVELDVPKQCLSFKQGGQAPRSVCVPVSPDSPLEKKEPELIVLSDSSEEVEVDVAVLRPCSPLPNSPCAVQKLQSFTQIKPQSIPKPTEPLKETKLPRGLELNPGDPSAALDQGHPGSGCDPSQGCSPEVSWLIPSTPVKGENCSGTSSTRSSSTQTKSSMYRTQLFPKGNVSSSRSSLLSSPALSLHNSSSAAGVSAHVGPTERSNPRLNLAEASPRGSSSDLNFSPQRNNSRDGSKSREVLNSSSSHRHPLQASSKQETPQHVQRQPYSSTPLHTELQLPPVLLGASPLNSSLDKLGSTSHGRDRASSESPEKTELRSFHLSPLSSPSSSHRGLHSSQKHKSSSESRRSVESGSLENTGAKLQRGGITNEGAERESEGKSEESHDGELEDPKEENEEAEIALSSFQQSFMDEPPIAFNDSWGLGACVEANPGCFSLRLEDSGGSSQQERSRERKETSSVDCPPPSSHCVQSSVNSSPSKSHSAQPNTSSPSCRNISFNPSPPDPNSSFMNPQMWDSWAEEQEEAAPLCERANPAAQLRTPVSSRNKKSCPAAPVTPMPHFSDMDTPDLKTKLNRFGVRPLPKRQMILKLKEIHQYTHQLVSSDSEEEAPSAGRAAQRKPPPNTSSAAAGSQTVKFKEPTAPAAVSPLKQRGGEEEEEGELLSASQGSNTSSTAASEESERSNPELCLTSDGDSDSGGGISASQAETRLQDSLQAVRSLILSDSGLYGQILQYQPLVLSQLQQRLKAAGIRLGAAKLADYLDSQCITFTTAKPGHSAPSRRRGKRTKAAGVRGAGRKKTATISI